MAITTTWPLKGTQPGQVLVAGSFRPAGTGAPTNVKGQGFTVARTGVGLYRVTFRESVPEAVAWVVGLRYATAVNMSVSGGVYNATNKTLDIRVFAPASTTVGGSTHVGFDLFGAREVVSNDVGINIADSTAGGKVNSGGLLSKDTAPKIEAVNGATDGRIRIVWAASDVTPILLPVVVPPFSGTYVPSITGLCSDGPTVHIDGWQVGSATKVFNHDTAALATAMSEVDIGGGVALTATPLYLRLTPAAHGSAALELYAVDISASNVATYNTATLTDFAANADNEISFAAISRQWV